MVVAMVPMPKVVLCPILVASHELVQRWRPFGSRRAGTACAIPVLVVIVQDEKKLEIGTSPSPYSIQPKPLHDKPYGKHVGTKHQTIMKLSIIVNSPALLGTPIASPTSRCHSKLDLSLSTPNTPVRPLLLALHAVSNLFQNSPGPRS
jgi:hypothetical protein